MAGNLPQLLEVRADLAGGRAVVHGLKRGGRDKEEGHTRLARHGLGKEGLTRSRRAFEEQAAPRGSAHLRCESLVGKEEVKRAHNIFLHRIDSLDIIQASGDLLRAVHDVGRSPGAECRPDNQQKQCGEEEDGNQKEGIDAGQPGSERVAAEGCGTTGRGQQGQR